MYAIIKKIILYSNNKITFLLVKLFFLSLIGAFLELFSLGMFIPVIQIFLGANVDTLDDINLFFSLNLTEIHLLFFVIIINIISSLYRIILLKFSTNSSFIIGKFFSNKIFSIITNFQLQDNKHLTLNTIIDYCIKKIDFFIHGFVVPIIKVFTFSILLLFILSAMLIINFKLTITTFVFIMIFYLIIIRYNKNKLDTNSKNISLNTNQSIKHIDEVINNSILIHINNLRNFYINKYSLVEQKIRRSQAENHFISLYPRPFLEVFILFLILIYIVINLIIFDSNIETFMFNMIFFIVAAQRILPIIQICYNSWAIVQSNKESSRVFIKFIGDYLIFEDLKLRKLKFSSFIFLENISIKLRNNNIILNNFSGKFLKNKIYGIQGPSGCGKSSFLLFISGFYLNFEGNYFADNKKIRTARDFLSFAKNVSYMPQETLFFDDTIYFNLTFDKSFDSKKNKLIIEYAKILDIHDLILKNFGSYMTIMDSRASNLSGGQKKLFAILRTIVQDKPILIFDEPTAGLDELKTSKVIKLINKIKKNKIIFIASHDNNLTRIYSDLYIFKNKELKKI